MGCPPAPVYKGVEEGGRAGPGGGAPREESYSQSGVGFPPSLVGVGERKEEGEREEGKGGRPPPLVGFGLGGGGGPTLAFSSFSTMAQ